MIALLKCTANDLNIIENFINKFNNKYETNIFPNFIEDIRFELEKDEQNPMPYIWYYLLSTLIEKHLEFYNIEYWYNDLCDKLVDFGNSKFRLKASDLYELTELFKEKDLNDNVLIELISEVNSFLER